MRGFSPACINSYKVFQRLQTPGTSNGDQIINLSLYINCLDPSLCDVTRAVDAAYDLGAVIFVASGNDASRFDRFNSYNFIPI
jgi:hypothetical protein